MSQKPDISAGHALLLRTEGLVALCLRHPHLEGECFDTLVHLTNQSLGPKMADILVALNSGRSLGLFAENLAVLVSASDLLKAP